MEQKNIYFIASYKTDMLDNYDIFINEENQKNFFWFKANERIIYVNRINLIKNKKEEGISIKIKNKEGKQNIYIIKLNLINNENKSNIFIFQYNLECISKEIYFGYFDSLCFWMKEERYVNQIPFSLSEKFSFFYEYLLRVYATDKKNFKILCIELIQTFFKEINTSINYKIEIDIGISILIVYNESNFLETFEKYCKQINKNSKCDIIKIKNNFEIFLDSILECLNNLKNYKSSNKNLIFEIIFIYFIEYRNKDIDILLNNYYQMLIDMLKEEKLYFLDDKYIDDEVFEKIIKHTPKIDNILTLLNKSEKYSSYIKRIDLNFEVIFDSIKHLKSLNGIFKIDCEVSQSDDINELIFYHNNLLDKQFKKGKYFISFLPILNKYYNIYNEYNNLEGLADVFKMIIIESKKFPKFKGIQNLKSKIILRIRDLLKLKIDYREINGKTVVKILLAIKEMFNDENIFDIKYKTYMIKYFIDKCKENDKNVIEEYKNNKIFELFINKDIEKNILFNIIKNIEFNINNNIFDLLPDELSDEELNVFSDLINKIIEKDENYNDIKKIFHFKFCEKKYFISLLEKIKINKINHLKIFNLIIGYLKVNKDKTYEKILEYLNENFFKKNIFFINNNNNINLSIPVKILFLIQLKVANFYCLKI